MTHLSSSTTKVQSGESGTGGLGVPLLACSTWLIIPPANTDVGVDCPSPGVEGSTSDERRSIPVRLPIENGSRSPAVSGDEPKSDRSDDVSTGGNVDVTESS